MAFNDIFTTSFFITLGITAILIAACIVYIEGKMREQNHKIASMLSLVSSVAEELNFAKMSINNLTLLVGGKPSKINEQNNEYNSTTQIPFVNNDSGDLIYVSDGEPINEENDDDDDDEDDDDDDDDDDAESSDDDDDDDDDAESSDDDDDEDGDDDDDDDDENEVDEKNLLDKTITILKINDETSKLDNTYLDLNDIDIEPLSNIEDLEIENQSDNNESKIIQISENDSHLEEVEFDLKKLSITKLKQLASNKGIKDFGKMKKPELIQLLEEV